VSSQNTVIPEGGAAASEVLYLVVRNDEEQYSIWRAGRELPAGWYATGFEGGEERCLEHIAEVWTDMRPLSVRRAMAGEGPGAA
jgi:MbtH protein